jgi:hypothetical protein
MINLEASITQLRTVNNGTTNQSASITNNTGVPINNTNITNSTDLPINLSTLRTNGVTSILVMTTIFGLMFCLWVYFGHLPTSRVAFTFKPNPALLRLITCSFDLLGRIIPELQTELELRGNTANFLLVKFLKNEIENANKIWASVKDNITAYFFTDGLVNLTEVTLRDGVFHKKDRNFDPKPLAQG